MKSLKLYSIPKGIDIKMKFPRTTKFVDYVTTKEVIFSEYQIIQELCTEETITISVRYHRAIINRKYISDWKLGVS